MSAPTASHRVHIPSGRAVLIEVVNAAMTEPPRVAQPERRLRFSVDHLSPTGVVVGSERPIVLDLHISYAQARARRINLGVVVRGPYGDRQAFTVTVPNRESVPVDVRVTCAMPTFVDEKRLTADGRDGGSVTVGRAGIPSVPRKGYGVQLLLNGEDPAALR